VADISYTMPAAALNEDTGVTPPPVNTTLYRPLPTEAKSKFTNELYIPLFTPDIWSMFNLSAEDRFRLGLVDTNPLTPISDDEPRVGTYQFKVPIHKIDKYTRQDGSVGYAQVICPVEMNNYLVQVLNRRPLFKNPTCSHCQASAKAWADHNAQWDYLKETRGIDKKGLTPDGYKATVNSDPILKDSRNRAHSFKVQYKYVLNVFDYSKFTGERAKAEDENFTHQFWFAPWTVFTGLQEIFEQDNRDQLRPFFDHNDPDGFQIIRVIKDTMACTSSNLRDTDYKVMKGPKVKLDDAWGTYLTTLENMADPSDMLLLLSSEEMALYAHPEQSMNAPAQTTAQPPQVSQQPPQQPPQVPQTQVQHGPPPVTTTAPTPPPVTTQQPPQVPAQGPPPMTMPTTTAPTPPPITQTAPTPPPITPGPPMPPSMTPPVTQQAPAQGPPPMSQQVPPQGPPPMTPPPASVPMAAPAPDRNPPAGDKPPGAVGSW